MQIAIDQDGEIVGDVAVGLDKGGADRHDRLHPPRRSPRQGIAREAVRAVVRRLFEHAGVHRIQAETAVENERSIRLLLDVGFTHEGTARESAWARALVDAAHFGLLESDPRP